MSRYLLDTHTLLWYSQYDSPLPLSLTRALQQPGAIVYISRVSLLEIAIKFGIGKLLLPDPLAIWLEKTVAAGFNLVEITNKHLVSLANLPLLPDHRDPFDRLLIAQALTENLTLLSRDSKFGAYAEMGLKLAWN